MLRYKMKEAGNGGVWGTAFSESKVREERAETVMSRLEMVRK